jgi:hypothetical protein
MASAAVKLALEEATRVATEKAVQDATKAAAAAAVKKAAAEATAAAIEKATKEAADAAIAKAGKEAADAAIVKAAKQASDAAAAKAAKEAADSAATKAAKEAADQAAKKASEDAAAQAAEAAAQKASKAASDDAAKGAEKVVTKQTKDEADAAGQSFLSKNKGLVVGGIAASTLVAASAVKFAARNDKKVTITKIEAVSGGLFSSSTTVKITYSPPLKILATDKVDIADTDCVPPLYKFFLPITKVLSDTEIVVAGVITAPGTKGSIVNHTSMQGQLADSIVTAGGAVVGAGANIAGGIVDQGLSSAGLPTISGLGAKLASYKYYILIAICLYFALKLYLGRSRAPAHGSKSAE